MHYPLCTYWLTHWAQTTVVNISRKTECLPLIFFLVKVCWSMFLSEEQDNVGWILVWCWSGDKPLPDFNSLRPSDIIGSDNGLSPERRKAIIWTNAGILSIEPSGTNCTEILIDIPTFPFKKMHLRMSPGKWQPFCLGLNVLIYVIGTPLLNWINLNLL